MPIFLLITAFPTCFFCRDKLHTLFPNSGSQFGPTPLATSEHSISFMYQGLLPLSGSDENPEGLGVAKA